MCQRMTKGLGSSNKLWSSGSLSKTMQDFAKENTIWNLEACPEYAASIVPVVKRDSESMQVWCDFKQAVNAASQLRRPLSTSHGGGHAIKRSWKGQDKLQAEVNLPYVLVNMSGPKHLNMKAQGTSLSTCHQDRCTSLSALLPHARRL